MYNIASIMRDLTVQNLVTNELGRGALKGRSTQASIGPWFEPR